MKDKCEKMNWQRARNEQQKEHRISEIVQATARLYERHRIEDISFALIAQEANFTRSNLYKYFSSKEEIFMKFLEHDIITWRKDLVQTFQDQTELSIPDFASRWVHSLSRHKRLLNLLSIMHVNLEKNVSEASLVAFKHKANDEMIHLTELLCSMIPTLDPARASEFITLQLTSAIGLYQMTNLTELQQKVLAYPEFQHMKIDFNTYLQKSVEYILNGLMK